MRGYIHQRWSWGMSRRYNRRRLGEFGDWEFRKQIEQKPQKTKRCRMKFACRVGVQQKIPAAERAFVDSGLRHLSQRSMFFLPILVMATQTAIRMCGGSARYDESLPRLEMNTHGLKSKQGTLFRNLDPVYPFALRSICQFV